MKKATIRSLWKIRAYMNTYLANRKNWKGIGTISYQIEEVFLMNNKNTNSADTRRGTLRMMLEMVGLVAPLKFQMMGAILLGVVGFLLSFGLGIFGGYAVVS